MYNFVFKNMWEQFHKVSNVYFLFIVILQMIPATSVTNGFPTIGVPLVFVLVVNGLKDAYEDWCRHKADAAENHQVARVITNDTEVSSELENNDFGKTDSFQLVEHTQKRSINEVSEKLDNSQKLGVADLSNHKMSVKPKNPSVLTAPNVEQLLYHNNFKIFWKDLTVGDFVFCRNNDTFPADLILLASSNAYGTIFVDTASLDGETNLKTRHVASETLSFISNDIEKCYDIVRQVTGNIECSLPNSILDKFQGQINLQLTAEAAKSDTLNLNVPIGKLQLLLRGCCLRNTAWALGIVVYTGKETKIQMNNLSSPHKTSSLERLTNNLMVLIVVFEAVLCLIGAIATRIITSKKYFANLTYLALRQNQNFFKSAITDFFLWVVLLANMVPISLVVTMGMVKAAQAYIIRLDRDMYDPLTNTYTNVKTSDLNEELGQIEHVFSDKTGTMTQNNMEFRKCCILGQSYGNPESQSESMCQNDEREQQKVEVTFRQTPHVNFYDKVLLSLVENSKDILIKESRLGPELEFFIHLATNHSVIIDEVSENIPGSSLQKYSFSSPDEGALVYSAFHNGVAFQKRESSKLILSFSEIDFYAEVLATLEFDSVRKRSSILCRLSFPSGFSKHVLYCKGADTTILNMLSSTNDPNILEERQKIIQCLENYAASGLRTLCVAKRDLSEKEVVELVQSYEAASRNLQNRDKALNELATKLEKNLELQGATGIEDLLQTGVPDTIETLREAGITIWMLTGDKVETAINIGVSTGLVGADSIFLIYDAEALSGPINRSKEEITEESYKKESEIVSKSTRHSQRLKSQLEADFLNLETTKGCVSNAENVKLKYLSKWMRQVFNFLFLFIIGYLPYSYRKVDTNIENSEVVIVVDGESLNEILQDELLIQLFIKIILYSKTVLCCRTTPYQKGAIVSLVKTRLNKITLAIGDGANDCPMIQAADVGVGIRGKEGMQAYNVSDYGITHFSFLKILLLCHGRWCYRRLGRLVLCMFYKNIVLILPVFYYAITSLYLGQKLYFEYLNQLYNVVLTSLPIIIYGIFDFDLNKEFVLKFPALYKLGQENHYINIPVFCRWLVYSIFQSFIAFYIPFLAYSNGAPIRYGKAVDLWFLGQTTFLIIMIFVTFKVLLESSRFTWMAIITASFNLFSWSIILYTFSLFSGLGSDIIGLFFMFLETPLFYEIVIGTVIIGTSLDYTWKSVRYTMIPELYDVIFKAQLKNNAQLERCMKDTESWIDQKPENVHNTGSLPIGIKPFEEVTSAKLSNRRNVFESSHSFRASRGYAFSEADARVRVILPHYRSFEKIHENSIKL